MVAGDIGIYRRWKDDEERYRKHVATVLDKLTSVSQEVYYVPGDTDDETVAVENAVNLDGEQVVVDGSERIGIFGVGGAPRHSLKAPDYAYSWDEGETFVQEDLTKRLRISWEKLQVEEPDTIVLMSHVPPSGFADKAVPLSLKQIVGREELPDEPITSEDASTNPVQLGSRILNHFLRDYEVDIQVAGHVHNRGGTHSAVNGTEAFNVSHVAPEPRKLYGRKILRLNLPSDGEIEVSWESIVNSQLEFETFLKQYL